MIKINKKNNNKKIKKDLDNMNLEHKIKINEIVISYEKVISQSQEYGHSDKRELAFLVIHSMLHLFGYDHMEETERLEMERIQEDILNKKGYTRDYE